MPGGRRSKFQDSQIQFLTDFHSDSPSDAISAVTKADPAVVTSTAHGRADGDVIRINGVLGMTELNGLAFIINVTGANNYQLLGVNSTNYGTYVSGGRVDVATMSDLCELTGYNRQGGSSPEIDATSICSEAAEYELGLPDFGTTQVDYNFAPLTTVQAAIQAAYIAGSPFAAKVVLPNSGGTMLQLGFVQQTSESVQKGDIWKGSFTMRNTGQRYDFA